MLRLLADCALACMLGAAAAVIPAVAWLLVARGRYSAPGWNHRLKRWWARQRLGHGYSGHTAGCCGTAPAGASRDERAERPRKLAGEDFADSMAVQGADLEGNWLVVRVGRRRKHMATVWLQLQLRDGAIYQLPDHPNTTVHNIQTGSWSARGLKLQMCQPLLRWRITFNGMLRRGIINEYRESDDQEEDLEHVRFSFMWTACSHAVPCDESCSAGLLSDAVARERWKDGSWRNMARELGAGYDQWGALQGAVSVAGRPEQLLYLRGLRQRRWGPDPPPALRRAVGLVVVQDDGLMVSLSAHSYRSGLSHVLMGHVLDNKGKQFLIDSCNFSLPDFGEEYNNIPEETRIKFSAGGRSYEAKLQVPAGDRATLFDGWPWALATTLAPSRWSSGGRRGTGLLQCCYRYDGSCPVVPPARAPLLVESSAADCPLVVSLGEEACRDSSCVGGKAASLALLSALQDRQVVVPPGLCLTVAAFQRQLRENSSLQEAVSALEDISTGRTHGDLKTQCERTVAEFERTEVCAPVREAVLGTSCGVDLARPCAVRSSAVGEDSEETSAAGQNATLLGVRGQGGVMRAVQRCWASCFSFRSVQYRRQHGQPVGAGLMGVVVQQMVTPRCAGVMFTAHPVSGNPRQVVITANYGLGESVVSAEVEPDSITLLRSSGDALVVHSVSRGSKSHKVTLAEGGGVATERLSEAEASRLSVSTDEALALGRLGLRVEAAFGAPRDVEWAISQDSIYLLQARPITSLDAWSDFEIVHEFDSPRNCDPEVFTTANLGEVMPGAMSPLCLSTLVPAVNRALERTVFDTDTGNAHLLVTAHAHVFLNVLLTTLVKVGEKLTMANRVTEVGVFGHSVVTPELHRLAVDRSGATGRGAQMLTLAKMLLMLLTSKRNVEEARKLAEDLKIDTHSSTADVLYEDITTGLQVLDQVALLHSQVTGGNTFIEIVLLTILMEGKEEFEMEHYSDISMLLSSCTNVVSADVPSDLKEVARLLERNGRAEEFRSTAPCQAYPWLQAHAPQAAARLAQFLSRHGHRGIKEFDFATETWGLDPSALMPSLQSMGGTLGPDGDAASREVLTAGQTVNKLTTPRKTGTKLALRCLLPVCRASVSRRESTKSSLVRVVHQLRLAYRELGRRMVREGLLPDPALVFFLSHYELRELLRARSPLLLTKATRRQRLWSQLDKLTFPEITVGTPVPIERAAPEAGGGNLRVVGTPVYPGTVVGRACVIQHLDHISLLQAGDVLITRSTDIGWSPYFPILGGVVTELGGIISHGAVVAREYGLPCVVGAQGATSAFHTGDLVLLTGSRGTIDRIQQSDVVVE
ncbi:prodigiosin synthesizing transferase PigC-like isoform X2 [Bacillus rossius redtenbacheri]